MTVTDIRTMMDLIGKFTEEKPLNIEGNPSQEDIDNLRKVQAELDKQDFMATFQRLAFYKRT